jgi:hypothetical protein
LQSLTEVLRKHPAVAEKVRIRAAYEPARAVSGGIPLGDDAAAIPDGDGYLILAAEGMLPGFVADDPWFAGYCAVMVNLSDVAAMGGRATAIVDVLWTQSREKIDPVWEGMRAASEAYGVPIVGGHTTTTEGEGVHLAAAVAGRARKLLTSFDAEPGDDLLVAVDLRGRYRNDKPFWNASVGAPPERLRGDLALLPGIAEAGLCRAAKDISNGGIPGTLVMFLECSGVGAVLDLDRLPMPPDVEPERWLLSFPSFGYLLASDAGNSESIRARFQSREIACERVGYFTEELRLDFVAAGERLTFWEATVAP